MSREIKITEEKLDEYIGKIERYRYEYELLQTKLDKAKEMILCLRELLDLTPKDIQDVAMFTWKELDEIFSDKNIKSILESD